MARYDTYRYLAGTGKLNWLEATVSCAAIANYNFVATHASYADIQAAGGVVAAVTRVINKSLTVTGWASSTALTLPTVPLGGPYDLVLFVDPLGQGDGVIPIVHYDNVVTLATSGDLVVRPNGALADSSGTWFRF